jgi:hypothetical protein
MAAFIIFGLHPVPFEGRIDAPAPRPVAKKIAGLRVNCDSCLVRCRGCNGCLVVQLQIRLIAKSFTTAVTTRVTRIKVLLAKMFGYLEKSVDLDTYNFASNYFGIEAA